MANPVAKEMERLNYCTPCNRNTWELAIWALAVRAAY